MKTMNSGCRGVLAGMACVALLTGCTAPGKLPSPPPPAAKKARPASTHATGWRTEPVIYNDRRYTVSFRQMDRHTRQVKVSPPGRTTAKDEKLMAFLAVLTVRHFTCTDSQQAKVRPGTMRLHDGHWTMIVECR